MLGFTAFFQTHRLVRLAACLLAVIAPGSLPPASAQIAHDAPRLRDIMLKALPPETQLIGLDFTIVHVDKAGNHKPIDTAPEAFPFVVGDRFKISVTAQDDLFIYVFNEGPTGNRTTLLPESADTPLRMKAGEKIDLPKEDPFVFMQPAGVEKLLVIALREHSPELLLIEEKAFKKDGATFKVKTSDEKPVKFPRIDDLEQSAASSFRKRAAPDLKKDAAESGQLIVTPDRTNSTMEAVSKTSRLVVPIALRSRPQPPAPP